VAKILNNVPGLTEDLEESFEVSLEPGDDDGCSVYDGHCTGTDGKCSWIDMGCDPPPQ